MIIPNIIIATITLGAIVLKAKSDGFYDEDDIEYDEEDEIRYKIGE